MILRLTSESIRVLFHSDETSNRKTEYYFSNGLYCESILDGGALLVTNASDEDVYGNQAKLAPVFTCRGLPILWPDGELYAAICVPVKTVQGP